MKSIGTGKPLFSFRNVIMASGMIENSCRCIVLIDNLAIIMYTKSTFNDYTGRRMRYEIYYDPRSTEQHSASP